MARPWFSPDWGQTYTFMLGVSQSRGLRTLLEQITIGQTNIGDAFDKFYYTAIAPIEGIGCELSRGWHENLYRNLGEKLQYILSRLGYRADVNLLGYVVENVNTGEIMVSRRIPDYLWLL